MPSMPCTSRQEIERAQTWPQTSRLVSRGEETHVSKSGSVPATTNPVPDLFEAELETNPGQHFLSPVQSYEYEERDDDDDDDNDDNGEDVPWDAGIIDFALFDDDRRRTEGRNQHQPKKWEGFLAGQTSAVERSLRCKHAKSDLDSVAMTASAGSMPDLTPDNSPNLRDDLGFVEHMQSQQAAQQGPRYRVVVIEPDSDIEEAVEEDDDDLLLSFYVDRGRKQRAASSKLKLQRPGLRYARTLSGKLHVWQRPSWDIYPVGEEPEAERRAEMGVVRTVDDDDARGRW